MNEKFRPLALACAFATSSLALAADDCLPFRALVQATWIEDGSTAVIGWQGPFAGTRGTDLTFGYLSSNGDPAPPTQTGHVGKEGEPSEKLDFGADGFLVTVADNKGVFPIPPGKGGWLMNYCETAKIAEGQGTGRYANASGFLTFTGSAIAYPVDQFDPASAWSGIWHGEINGRICNVAP